LETAGTSSLLQLFIFLPIYSPCFSFLCSLQENDGDANTNKRAREDDEADDAFDGPDKKRPTNGMASAGVEGSDPPAGGLDGGVDPVGGVPGAEVCPCFYNNPSS
jgi:hypothetical protein